MAASEGLEKAAAKAGGYTSLAKALGVSHQAVYVWKNTGRVPAARCMQIEELYGIPWRELGYSTKGV